jgi:putative ABC transport system ATP-binding protein
MPLIQLQNVERHYPAGQGVVRALDGIDLAIGSGEYVAILGASGSGKSTLMGILGCLDTPTRGTYLLDGTDVSHLEDDALAGIRNRKIGFVFQTFHLLPRSHAVANVALPLLYSGLSRWERQERASAALEQVGLEHRLDHRPNELSGGECQRVAIARALVNEPSILLADEPTGNLDSGTSSEIMEQLREVHASGTTIILVTHDSDVAQHAKRIIRLKDGHIVEDRRQG